MWQGNNVFQLLIVQSGGKNTGLFVYNGPGAKGNLVAQIVAPGVTSDPFGNTVSAVANFGAWSAGGAMLQHFGIDQNGKLYLVDASGKIRIFLDPSIAAQLIYDTSGQSLNHLASSVASAGGTDSAGNVFQPGVSAYQYVGGSLIIIAQLANGGLQVGTPTQFAGTGGAAPGTVTGLQFQPDVLLLQSPVASSTDVAGSIEISSQSGSPSGVPMAGIGQVLGLTSTSVTPTQVASNVLLFADTAGFLRANSGLVGDSNNYWCQHSLVQFTGSQTISSTGFTTLNSCQFTVGAGRYIFRARVTYSGAGTSGSASFQVSAPTPSGQWINALFNMSSGTAGTGAQNAALGPVNSPTLTTGQNVADIEGEVTTGVNGTLALQGAITAGGSNWSPSKAHFWLFPIQ